MAESVPRRAAGVSYEVVEGQAVVIDPEGRELVTLNRVGTLIWEQVDGQRTEAELIDELFGTFEGVSRDDFERDVRAYLGELREARILEPDPPA